tara:strand:+ start:388 stop:519 length:132 start_codon:yes stop_codon:yes gene_type:complete
MMCSSRTSGGRVVAFVANPLDDVALPKEVNGVVGQHRAKSGRM